MGGKRNSAIAHCTGIRFLGVGSPLDTAPDRMADHNSTPLLQKCRANIEYPAGKNGRLTWIGSVRNSMDGIREHALAGEMDCRSASASAVRKFRQPLVEYLICGLDDNDKWVRVMAAEMLGALGDPRSVRSLQPLLAGWDSDLRMAAARSLARIRSPQSAAIPLALSCDQCMIRLVADEALMRLKLEQDHESCR